MKRKFALGIDPGQTGAVSIFEQCHIDGEWYLNTVLDYNSEAVLPVLRELIALHSCCSAVIEAVHAAPGQGVSSTFKFGANFGWWLGVLDTLLVSYTLVSPQKWQGTLFKKYKTPTGGLKGTTKEVSLQVAKELFSRENDTKGWFDRKKDHGRSDASLIGWYGIQQLQ